MEQKLLKTSAHDQGQELTKRQARRAAQAKRRELDRLTQTRNGDRLIFWAVLLVGIAIGVAIVFGLSLLVSSMTEGSWTKVGNCQVNGLIEVCS